MLHLTHAQHTGTQDVLRPQNEWGVVHTCPSQLLFSLGLTILLLRLHFKTTFFKNVYLHTHFSVQSPIHSFSHSSFNGFSLSIFEPPHDHICLLSSHSPGSFLQGRAWCYKISYFVALYGEERKRVWWYLFFKKVPKLLLIVGLMMLIILGTSYPKRKKRHFTWLQMSHIWLSTVLSFTWVRHRFLPSCTLESPRKLWKQPGPRPHPWVCSPNWSGHQALTSRQPGLKAAGAALPSKSTELRASKSQICRFLFLLPHLNIFPG